MKNMTTHFVTPFGEFDLHRIPDNDKNLQAWNSADSHLLNHLFEAHHSDSSSSSYINLKDSNLLILNDDFGALSLPMLQFSCDTLSDSFISHDAIGKNIQRNCPEFMDRIRCLKSTDELDKVYDVVLFKNIKSQAYLKDQMQKIARHIHPGTILLGASMAKNLQKASLEILSKIFGQANASLTWKKSRLIHIEPILIRDNKTMGQQKPFTPNIVTYQLADEHASIYSLANVFSRNKLDIGTQFFLKHFPELTPEQQEADAQEIIDLGCGNGVLALKAAKSFPEANITCVDESYMAVASAKLTIESNLDSSGDRIKFIAGNALNGFEQGSADLILCNPPFHQQYVVGDAIAWQMFKQAKRVLKKGGEIWVVGNRHLGYHLKLKKIFGNQTLIAGNKKFVILKSQNN